MAEHKIQLNIIVNGTATEVEANPEAPLHTVIAQAIEQTGNMGQPADNWELRDLQGNLLDLGRKVGSFGFNADTRLFLNLKAGVGG